MVQRITARPLSAKSPCQTAAASCRKQVIWVGKNLEHGSMHYTASLVYREMEMGRFENMYRTLEGLRQTAVDFGDTGWELTANNLLGHYYLAEGQVEQADAKFQEVAHVANRQHTLYAAQLQEALFGWALCSYDLERHADFVQRVEQCVGFNSASGCPCADDIRNLVLSALKQMRDGSLTNAISLFQEVIARYSNVSDYYKFVAVFGIVECALLNGETKSAQDQLEAIDADVVHGRGWGAALMWLPRFPNAYTYQQQNFNHWPVLGQHVESAGIMTRQDEADIRIESFGNGDVYRGKSYRDFTGSRGALMLVTFLAKKQFNRGVRLDDIMFSLWPHATKFDPFNTAIRDARALLGVEMVTRDSGVIQLNGRVWLDSLQFEQTYNRALQLPITARFDPLFYCASLYRGPFLQTINTAWVDDQRLQYRNMMTSIWWQMGACYALDGQIHKSIQCLENALDIDPYHEQAVSDLMRQLDQVGKRPAAIQFFEIYAARLFKQFEMVPSPNIARLAERLRTGDNTLTAAFQVSDLFQPTRHPTPPPDTFQPRLPDHTEGDTGWIR